jgi:fatty acid desaturase
VQWIRDKGEETVTSHVEERLTAPPPEVRQLVKSASTLDDWRNWVYLLTDYGVAVGVAIAAQLSHSWVVYLLAVVMIGSRMRAVANLLHEASHRKLFRNRFMNDAAGILLLATPLACSFREYARLHTPHHVYLWDEHSDPDAKLYFSTRTAERSDQRCGYAQFLLVNVALVVFPARPLHLFLVSLRDQPSRALKLGVVSVVMVIADMRDWAVGSMLTKYWLVPFLTAYLAIAYWAELGEHGGLRSFGRRWGSRNWKGNPVSRWLIGSHSDDVYHLLHHLFPSVPHYNLRKLDLACSRAWPNYERQFTCGGFFFGSRDTKSVMHDIWRPDLRRGLQRLPEAS